MDLSEGRDNIVSSGSVFFWDGMGKNFDLLICLKFYIESDSVFVCFKFSFSFSVHNTLMDKFQMTQAAAGGEKHCNRFWVSFYFSRNVGNK